MEYLQYNIHKILWSKYKFLINIFIFSSVYLSFYAEQFSYCMTEEDVASFTISKKRNSFIEEVRQIEPDSVLVSNEVVTIENLQNNLSFIKKQQKKLQTQFSEIVVQNDLLEASLAEARIIEQEKNLYVCELLNDTQKLIHFDIECFVEACEDKIHAVELENARLKEQLRTLMSRLDSLENTRVFEDTNRIIQSAHIHPNTEAYTNSSRPNFIKNLPIIQKKQLEPFDFTYLQKQVLENRSNASSSSSEDGGALPLDFIFCKNRLFQANHNLNLKLYSFQQAIEDQYETIGKGLVLESNIEPNIEQGCSRKPADPLVLAKSDIQLKIQKMELFSTRRRK